MMADGVLELSAASGFRGSPDLPLMGEALMLHLNAHSAVVHRAAAEMLDLMPRDVALQAHIAALDKHLRDLVCAPSSAKVRSSTQGTKSDIQNPSDIEARGRRVREALVPLLSHRAVTAVSCSSLPLRL